MNIGKFLGYVEKAIGRNTKYTRALVSSETKLLEGTSIDLLRSLKLNTNAKQWDYFVKEELKLAPRAKGLGKLELEKDFAKTAFEGEGLTANNWKEYMQNVINLGKTIKGKGPRITEKTTYGELAKNMSKNC